MKSVNMLWLAPRLSSEGPFDDGTFSELQAKAGKDGPPQACHAYIRTAPPTTSSLCALSAGASSCA